MSLNCFYFKSRKCLFEIKYFLFNLFALSFSCHRFNTRSQGHCIALSCLSHQFESLKSWMFQQRALEHKENQNMFLSCNAAFEGTFFISSTSFHIKGQAIKHVVLAYNDHLLTSLTFTQHLCLFSCSSLPGGRWCKACGSTVPQFLSSSSSPSLLMDHPLLPHNLLNLRARLGEEVDAINS